MEILVIYSSLNSSYYAAVALAEWLVRTVRRENVNSQAKLCHKVLSLRLDKGVFSEDT